MTPGVTGLPAVRIAPLGELAAAARTCDRLRSVQRLAEWVGSRRIAKSGNLMLADARRAVQELRLPGDQGPGRSPARTAAGFPELQALWELAVSAELLYAGHGSSQHGPALEALRGDDDEEVVEIWADLLRAPLDRAFWSPVLSELLLPLLVELHLARGPIPTPELVIEAAAAQHGLDPDTIRKDSSARILVSGYESAVDAFVVELVAMDAAIVEGSAVTLTALGRYGLSAWFATVGLDAPLVQDLAEASASDLLDLGFTVAGPEQLDALFADWTAARGVERAAVDLAEYADGGTAEGRATAFMLLDRIGDAATAAVRGVLDLPALRPHATAWLRARGLDGPEPTLAEARWLFVDIVAANLADDEESLRESIVEQAHGQPDQSGIIAELWQSDHPQTLEVLELLSRLHPNAESARAARKAAMRGRPAEPATVPVRDASTYQLKITLEDVKPPVWRRIQVAGSITLAELHAQIQTAMGWTNSHLHQFEIDGVQYGEADLGGSEEMVDEAQVSLSEVGRGDARFEYVYDFGDDWRHEIVVERVQPAEAGENVPVCVAGRRGCPPEDVGGPWGYADFLAAYGDPAHPEHQEMREWGGADLDPERFDAAEVTDRLRRFT